MTWTVAGASPSVQNAAAALLTSAAAAFSSLVAGSGIDPGLTKLKSALVTTNSAANIAAAVTSFCQAYSAAIIRSWTPFDDTLSSRGPQPVADPSYGLAALAIWTPPPAPGQLTGSGDAATIAANQTIIIALVQGCAVTAYARLSALASYSSQNDAENARDAITGLIDTEATNAANNGFDASYAQWKLLEQAVSIDLTTRGKKVPNVVDYVFKAAQPALALAQRLYQDGTRAGELIARNAAPFPLFLPLNIEALAF